eukprot:COSAG06_NODE_45444_length_354_cov_10.235294_1_plen_25_part_01
METKLARGSSKCLELKCDNVWSHMF